MSRPYYVPNSFFLIWIFLPALSCNGNCHHSIALVGKLRHREKGLVPNDTVTEMLGVNPKWVFLPFQELGVGSGLGLCQQQLPKWDPTEG